MEFFDAIERRQSIRQFEPTAVEWDKLMQVLGAANRAPSAGNLQAYRIFVMREPWERQVLARAAGDQRHVAEAPLALVFCVDPARSAARYGARGEQLYCIQDATIACAYAQLAAASLELASVWIGTILEPEVVRASLGITEDLWPIALLLIGYPAEAPIRPPRRDLQDLVSGLRPDEWAALPQRKETGPR